MNPFVPLCGSLKAVIDDEPKSTAEKIGRAIQKKSYEDRENELRQHIYRVESEGGHVNALLCEEIDALRERIEKLEESRKG